MFTEMRRKENLLFNTGIPPLLPGIVKWISTKYASHAKPTARRKRSISMKRINKKKKGAGFYKATMMEMARQSNLATTATTMRVIPTAIR
jgi:hypothetical protein